MSKAKRIAIFGGSFDPFCHHHFAAVQAILDGGHADEVVLAPAMAHKTKSPVASLEDRVAMIEAHLYWARSQGTKAPSVSVRAELDGTGSPEDPAYGSSYNLVYAAKAAYPGSEILLVIGADCARSIGTWWNSKGLLNSCRFLLLPRDGDKLTKLPKGMYGEVVSGFHFEGSSTEARRRLMHGDTGNSAKDLMAPPVWLKGWQAYKHVPLSTGGPTLLPDCTNYDDSGFKKGLHTVDTSIVRLNGNKLEVLLIKRKWHPHQGKWAIPGGFLDLDKGETLDQAAARELDEETGAKGIPVRQLGTYGDPGRDPRGRVITTAYFALVPVGAMSKKKLKAKDDASGYQWRELSSSMFTHDLAFDHARILGDLRAKIKEMAEGTDVAFGMVDRECFTWRELADAYEAMLGSRPDTSNLSRNIRVRYVIEPSQKSKPRSVKGAGRTASTLAYRCGRTVLGG